MDTWTELMNGPLRSEMLQLEILFHEMIELIPLITFSAIALFFGLFGLLAVIDRMFLEYRDLQQTNKLSIREEQHLEPATRILVNDTNAAA